METDDKINMLIYKYLSCGAIHDGAQIEAYLGSRSITSIGIPPMAKCLNCGSYNIHKISNISDFLTKL